MIAADDSAAVDNWLAGVVVRGDGRGRKLGFPTANLELADETVRPPEGVYAAWAKLGDVMHKAAVHVGPRPTFEGAAPTVEAHLLNFPDRDLYDETISIQVVARLRDVKKFDSVEELQVALTKDCKQAAARLVPLQSDGPRNDARGG